jgi:hypothetical protein
VRALIKRPNLQDKKRRASGYFVVPDILNRQSLGNVS